jgi:lipopolysaccharide transport system permease protein
MIAHPRDSIVESAIPTVIEPSQGWVRLGLRELWSYRELGYFFVWRDLKVRYKQTAFGVLWAVIQPLVLMVVFSLFLGRLGGIAPLGVPYPLFAFAALVPWTLFSKSVIGSSESLVGSAGLIQKVYFPRLLLPISALGSQVADFGIAMVVLEVLALYFGVSLSPTIVWVIPLAFLTLIIALAVGRWFSAANVRYRDVRQLVPLLIQVWLFSSPVAYSSGIVPPQWLWLYDLNPLVGIIEGFRWAVIGGAIAPPLEPLLVSGIASAIVLVTGLVYFRRVERTFADVI